MTTPLSALKKHSAPLLLLAIFTIAAYRDVYHQNFLTNWDDALYVTDNIAAQGFSLDHLKRAFTSFFAGNFAPVQVISYMLDYELWGMWPGGYKLTNLLCHLANGTIFYAILVRHYSATRLAAFGAAFIFLCHPVQVESVAWVSQRKTVLSCLFMLISWEAYLRSTDEAPSGHRRWYILSLAAYGASLFSKTTTVVLLPLLLIHEWLREKQVNLRNKLPFLAISLIAAAVTLVSQSPEYHGGITHYHGGSPLTTLLTMLTVLPRYLYIIIWPLQLSAAYAPTIHTGINLAVLSSSFTWLILLCIGLFLVRKQPRLAFWYLLFFVALLPVAQIIPIVTIMNDRYLYLPLLGVAGCAGYGIQSLQLKLPRPAGAIALTLLFLALATLPFVTAGQTAVWRSGVTLWQSAADRMPHAPEAWTGLADAFQKENNLAAALSAYLRALRVKPDNDIALNNIALIYLSLGKPEKAGQYATELLTINKSAPAHITLGMVYYAKKDYVKAEEYANRALAIDPNLENALLLMGDIAITQERFADAQQLLMRALELHGPVASVLISMATLDGAWGKQQTAARLLVRALEAGYRDGKALRENRHLTAALENPEIRQIVNNFIPGTF